MLLPLLGLEHVLSGGSSVAVALNRAASLLPPPVQQKKPQHEEEALERGEDAGDEADEVCGWAKGHHGEYPGSPEQDAQAPDAKEGNTILLPLFSGPYMSVHKKEHCQAR